MDTKKIRVLQIVPTLGFGGVAQFLLNYYAFMDKSQIQFDFVTHGNEETFHKDLIESGSRIFYFQSVSKIGLGGYLKQLKHLFASNEYDIVHTHDGHLTGLTAMFCRIYYKGKIFCHAHTTKCVNKKHEFLMPWFRFLSRSYGDRLLGCGIKACKYCFGKKATFVVIHNAVSLDRFWDIDKLDAKKLKYELGIPDDAFVIGHVGQFCFPKNHHYIIRLFQFILQKHPNTILVLVGDGIMKKEIEEFAKEMEVSNNVRFVGIQNNIPLYMHIFDAFILPSHFEGLPVCGIEAQTVVKNICFSDNIDKDVDAGIGSVSFIPITDDAFYKWEEQIFSNKEIPQKEWIKKCFIESGYEISKSAESLFRIYRESVK